MNAMDFDRLLELADKCDARGDRDLAADFRIAAARGAGLQPLPLPPPPSRHSERRRGLREIA